MILTGTPAALACLGLATVTAAAIIGHTHIAVGGVAVVLAAVWLATLDGWRRLYAVLLLLTVCGASNLDALSVPAYYLRYVAAAALAWWTWRSRSRRSTSPPTRASSRLSWALWCLALIATASVAWSITRVTTAQQVIALIFLVGLVHSLARYRWVDRSDRITGDLSVAYVVLTGSFVASVLADRLGVPRAHVYGGRLQGIYSNPNTLGDLIGLAIPLGIGLFLSSRRPIYLVGLIPAVIALAECQTRTAVVAVVTGITWLWVRRSRTVALTRVLGVVFAGALASAVIKTGHLRVPGLFGGITLRFNADTPGGLLNSRTVAWSDALALWGHRPVQGYGFQAGDTLFNQLYGGGLITFSAAPAHNSYVQALLELGLLGTLPLAVILFGTVLPVLFAARVDHAASPFIGVVVAGLAIQLTESAMFGTGQPYPWVFWPALAALSCAVIPRRKPREVRALETQVRGVITVRAQPTRLELAQSSANPIPPVVK